jgi:hypothetical protein
MQQSCTYGSVRGASGNWRPYRDKSPEPRYLLKQKHVLMFQKVMRGTDTQQSSMFSYLSPEERVPVKHPLRPIRLMVDDALKVLSPSFSRLYSAFGRPSIPPEKLLRALLLQVSIQFAASGC